MLIPPPQSLREMVNRPFEDLKLIFISQTSIYHLIGKLELLLQQKMSMRGTQREVFLLMTHACPVVNRDMASFDNMFVNSKRFAKCMFEEMMASTTPTTTNNNVNNINHNSNKNKNDDGQVKVESSANRDKERGTHSEEKEKEKDAKKERDIKTTREKERAEENRKKRELRKKREKEEIDRLGKMSFRLSLNLDG